MPHLKNLLSAESLKMLDNGLKRKATEMKIKALKNPKNFKLRREAERWDDLATK